VPDTMVMVQEAVDRLMCQIWGRSFRDFGFRKNYKNSTKM